MGYFSRTRGRVIVLCFVLSSLLFAAFPEIDLSISRLFYAGHFPFSDTWLQKILRDGTTGFLCISVFAVVGAYAFNRLLRRNLWGIDGKRVCYLAIVLVLGAGVIVNLAFKDTFGRARPREVAEFGGTKAFTPAFALSTQCRKNCSFSSGEGAAGFFSIALFYALSRRRAVLIAALTFGVTVSFARIAAGAHFLSDTVVSFFVMWQLADALHYYMRLAPPAAESAAIATTGTAPAA